jgi:hypothetical protein
MPADSAIPVAVHGFTWTTALVGLLNLLVGGALVSWIRSRPQLRQIETSSEEKLRSDLLHRVETLERKLEEKEAIHAAEMAIMRHRVNNSDQCLDALLLLIEQSPAKVKEAVAKIKEMRRTQREAEAAEKAALLSANIARAGGGDI